MTTWLIAAALALLAAYALWRTHRRATKGSACCGDRAETVRRIPVGDRNAAHYPYTAEADIGGMTCENCARRVENSLNTLPGIWATVDIGKKQALIRGKAPLSEESLRQAVAQAGYVLLRLTPKAPQK